MIGGVNVAEALISKGLATVVRYAAGNDERSGKFDELLQVGLLLVLILWL